MARKKRGGSLLGIGLDALEGISFEVDDGFGGGMGDTDLGVTPGREQNFNRGTGRFHDPATGQFEAGSPPPDLDTGVDRYRAKNGQFKSRPADLYDEPDEVLKDSLDPFG